MLPKLKKYVEPEIVETVKSIEHFVVDDQNYLIKNQAKKAASSSGSVIEISHDSITVFEIGDDNFITIEEAEKKLKILMRKQRELVRYVSRMFGIENVSSIEKSEPMKWLFEHYTISSLLSIGGNSLKKVEKWGYSYFTAMASMVYRAYPETCMPGLPSKVSDQKTKLVNLRMLELLHISAKSQSSFNADGSVKTVPSIRKAFEGIQVQLLIDELRDVHKLIQDSGDPNTVFKGKATDMLYSVHGKFGAAYKRF